MLRELNSEPSAQFFQELFGLVGLGEISASTVASQPDQSCTALQPR